MKSANALKLFLITALALATLANTGTAALNITGLATNTTNWIASATGGDVSVWFNVTVNGSTNITNFNISVNDTPTAVNWGAVNITASFQKWAEAVSPSILFNATNFSSWFRSNSSANNSAGPLMNFSNGTNSQYGPTFTGTSGFLNHTVNMTIHFRANATGNYTIMLNVTDNYSATDSKNFSIWFDYEAPRVSVNLTQGMTWPLDGVAVEQTAAGNLSFNVSAHSLLNDTDSQRGLNISVPSANTTSVWYLVRNVSGANMTPMRLLVRAVGVGANRSNNWSATTNSLLLNTSILSEGGYNLSLNATDEAGNWNTTEYRTFYVNRSENASTFFMWASATATQYTAAVTFTVYTSSNATCKYNESGSQSDLNGGTSMTASGHVFSGSYTPAGDGQITLYFVCGNKYNVYNTTSVLITRDTYSQIPPLPPTTTTAPGTTSGTVSSIAAGTTGTVAINSLEVTTVEVTVVNTATSVQVSSQPLDAAPTTVTQTVPGNVYKYLDINTQNLAPENIQKAVINFKVTKTWLTNNNFTPESVKLNRWENTSWSVLNTTQTGDDSTYYYYKAESPGFSIFAVTAGPGAGVVTPPPTNVTQPPANVTPPPEEEQKVAAGIDWTLIGIVVAIVIIIAAAVFFLKPKKYPITGRR